MRSEFLKSIFLSFCFAVGVGYAADPGADTDNVHIYPTSLTTQVDNGELVNGEIGVDSHSATSDDFIQRTSVWVTEEAVVQKRLDIKIGVGGLYWYAVPGPSASPDISSVTPYSSRANFGPGISRADLTYTFGDLQKPTFTLQAGLFPYKYDEDAMDLGEYLLRSGTYPGYVVSGGWDLLSEANYMMQGVRLNMSLWDGKFQSDFLLPQEHDYPPTNDISPSYVGSVTPVKGLEFGFGASSSHCISVQPSKTSPDENFSTNGKAEQEYGGYGNAYVVNNPKYNPNEPTTDFNVTSSDPTYNPKYIYDTTGHYTFMGVKLMARFAFDPKAFIPMPMLGPKDLRIFGEAALLGVKDYPFYYDDRWRRIPVMMGINLPTFRLLDLLSFQVEYYDSKFPNSVYNPYQYGLPTYDFVDNTGALTNDPNDFDPDNEAVTRDKWKWAVYAKKQVIRGLSLYAQVADDNMRLPSVNDIGALVYTQEPATNIEGRDWYYLIRLELGI